jgi:hypothetical protein
MALVGKTAGIGTPAPLATLLKPDCTTLVARLKDMAGIVATAAMAAEGGI